MFRSLCCALALVSASAGSAAVITGFSFAGPGVSAGFVDFFTGEVIFPPDTPVRVSGDIEILNPLLQPDAGATGVFDLGSEELGDHAFSVMIDVPGFRTDVQAGELGSGSFTLDNGTLVGFQRFAYYEEGFGIDVRWAGTSGSYEVTLSFTFDPCCGHYGTFEIDSTNVRIAAVPEPASWVLMIAGFGLVGGALRRQGRGWRQVAA